MDDRPPPRDNAVGLVRLLLAAGVVLAHVPELTDGDRHREPLTRAFGALSLGEVAVDGFFLLSGFLLAASLARARAAGPYLLRRAARVWPGFLCAQAVCVYAVAPLAGAAVPPLGDWLLPALFLLGPDVGGAFAGHPYPQLDGALWTIGYEVRCYLLLLLIQRAGLLRRPAVLATAASLLLLAFEAAPEAWLVPYTGTLLLLDPFPFSRLLALFLAGTAYHACRPPLAKPALLALAAGALTAGLAVPHLGHLAMATAGGYLLLSFAFHPPAAWARGVGTRQDWSYGLYLYAWPTTNLLLWWFSTLPLAATTLLTLAVALACGALSWNVIEQPAIAAAARRLRRRPQTEPALA